VQQVHREFLLLRDYAGLAALFLVGFGAVALFTVQPPKVLAVYCLLLIAQFVIVRHAAATYGIRFVTTVLALKASAPATTPRTPAKRAAKSAKP
jgi:membrane protein YqaA with SNARE-associated domain